METFIYIYINTLVASVTLFDNNAWQCLTSIYIGTSTQILVIASRREAGTKVGLDGNKNTNVIMIDTEVSQVSQPRNPL